MSTDRPWSKSLSRVSSSRFRLKSSLTIGSFLPFSAYKVNDTHPFSRSWQRPARPNHYVAARLSHLQHLDLHLVLVHLPLLVVDACESSSGLGQHLEAPK
jgi:hypothetical protein